MCKIVVLNILSCIKHLCLCSVNICDKIITGMAFSPINTILHTNSWCRVMWREKLIGGILNVIGGIMNAREK